MSAQESDKDFIDPETGAKRDWVIRKGGYFYRPNSQGYTTDIGEAGLYTEDEAKAEAAIEPDNMRAAHESEFPPSPLQSALNAIEDLRAQLAAKKIAGADGWCFDMSLAPFHKSILLSVPWPNKEPFCGEGYLDRCGQWKWTDGFAVGRPIEAWHHLPSPPGATPSLDACIMCAGTKKTWEPCPMCNAPEGQLESDMGLLARRDAENEAFRVATRNEALEEAAEVVKSQTDIDRRLSAAGEVNKADAALCILTGNRIERAILALKSPESQSRAAIEAANTWQPIETAPKDGTRILGYTPAGIFTIYWLDEQSVSDCGRAVIYAGWWSDGGRTRPGSNMANPAKDDGEDLGQDEPTRWMPLPAEPDETPPNEAKGGEYYISTEVVEAIRDLITPEQTAAIARVEAAEAERDHDLMGREGMADTDARLTDAIANMESALTASRAESALTTSRATLRAALDRLVNAKALSGVRELVAGWNGEDRPEPHKERHPKKLGATLPKTNCGAVYDLDEAMQAARAALASGDAANG